MALCCIALFPVVPILILAAAFARFSHLRTGNIWLSGFVNALLLATILVADTATEHSHILS